MVYCHDCNVLSTNVLGEHDVCTRCGRPAERVEFHRPWQYYASSVMLLAAAAVFVLGPVEDTLTRILIFLVVLVVSVILSNWGMAQARSRIMREIAKRKAAEEKA